MRKTVRSSLATGFTFLEMLLVLGILSIIIAIIVINVLRPQQQASLQSVVATLTADLKSQQLKSMVGEGETLSSAQEYGIYFTESSYTLFQGSTYVPGAATNFVVQMDADIRFVDVNLPNDRVVFLRVNGEVQNFTSSENVVVVQSLSTNEQRRIILNKLGVVTTE